MIPMLKALDHVTLRSTDLARTRGFYGRYAEVAGEDPARDWTDAVAQLEATLQDDAERARRTERSRALSAEFHAHRDGRNAERVFAAIRARSAPADRPRSFSKGTA